MAKNDRSWLKGLEIVYGFYCKKVQAAGGKPTQTGFWKHLGSTRGKFQKWSKGQWPSAEDLQSMHEKFGFSYRWLVTGEGEPFDESEQIIRNQQKEIARLQAQIFVQGASEQAGQTLIGEAASQAL